MAYDLPYNEEQGYDLNQLRKRRIGPFSDYAQVQDPDAYYKNVMKSDPTFATHMGARDDYLPTSHPRAEEKTAPGYGYYPYTEESDPDFRPGDERRVWMNQVSPAMKYYYPQKKGITSLDTSMYGGDQDIYGIENARGLFRPSQQSTDFNIKYGPEGITYYDKDEPQIFPKEKPILEDPNFQEGRKQHGETYGPLGPDPFKLPSIREGLGAIRNMIPNPLNPESKNYNPRLQGQVDELNARGMLGDVRWNDAGRIIGDNPLAGQNLVSGFGTNDYEEMLQKRIDYFNRQKAKKGKRFTDEQQRRLDATIAEQQRKGDASRAAQVSDRAKIEAYTGRPMSEYRASRPASERRYTGHGRSGMGRDPSDRMAYGGRVGYQGGGPPGGGDPGMKGTGRDYGSSYGPGRDPGWSPGAGGRQHIPTHVPTQPTPTITTGGGGGGGGDGPEPYGYKTHWKNILPGGKPFRTYGDWIKETDWYKEEEEETPGTTSRYISNLSGNPLSWLGVGMSGEGSPLTLRKTGETLSGHAKTIEDEWKRMNQAQGGRVGYKTGGRVGILAAF